MLHPDVIGTGNTAAFVAVKLSYDVLVHPERRAAYDRAARQTSRAEIEPGQIPNPRPVVMRSAPTRQPRWSDLPMAVWVGMVSILCLGVMEVVLHLTALPTPATHTDIHANAPIIAPASEAVTRELTFGPAPIRLAGTPNFYVLPAAGLTVLFRHDTEHNVLVPNGLLPPFSSVQALRLFRQKGLIEVRVTESTTGLVPAAHLTPGDVASAHRAYCAYNAGPIPANGELLYQRGSGSGRIELDNRTTQPAVVKLRDAAGLVAASVFLTPGGHAELNGLPEIRFRMEFAIGELWSRACNGFAAGMRAQRLAGYFSLAALTPLAIPPDLPGEAPAVDISDQMFEQE
jgi:hypothetical protein